MCIRDSINSAQQDCCTSIILRCNTVQSKLHPGSTQQNSSSSFCLWPVSSNMHKLWLPLLPACPFHQLASPPGSHVTHIPKGNLVVYTRWFQWQARHFGFQPSHHGFRELGNKIWHGHGYFWRQCNVHSKSWPFLRRNFTKFWDFRQLWPWLMHDKKE